jgi:GDP-4-dehydro-6-deoxy-D-mannose reductase
MRLFITGAAGFTGRFLIDEFLNNFHNEIEIYGLIHKSKNFKKKQNKCFYIEGDLLDRTRINHIISEICPDYIIHLAGLNRGTTADLFNVNVIGTENILNAVLQSVSSPRILIVGSSAEYGYSGEDPISETTPIRPLSIYGISKAASSMIAFLHYKKYQEQICVVKPFNIIGPGQNKDFFCGNLISQIEAYRNGEINLIELFNPDSRRDYIDVRDVVRAYRQLLCHEDFSNTCNGKIFNIGSGHCYSVRETFELVNSIIDEKFLFNIQTIDNGDLIPSQICDYGFIKRTTGWEPTIPFIDSLRDMIKENNITAINRP